MYSSWEPSPFIAAASASRPYSHCASSYSSVSTAERARAPVSGRSGSPVSSGVSSTLSKKLSSCSFASASSPRKGQASPASRQRARKASVACSKPSAWPAENSSMDMSGSIAPSRTKRPTRSGCSSA